MKQIAVIGMSSFGYYLALRLSELGNEVIAIDRDEAMVDKIKSHVAKAIIADASDIRVLKQLSLNRMDSVVLSLGDKLEASILATMHLKEMKIKKIIAKATSDDHAKILEMLGVDQIVFPERDMGVRIASSLDGKNISDFLPLGPGLSIIETTPRKEMIGKTLKELDFRNQYQCQVMAIKVKEPEEKTFIPEAETKIKNNHLLLILGNNPDLAKF